MDPEHVGLGKRVRELHDIEDRGRSEYTKKRRLRRDLITSRLSLPFASPPTNIPSPSACSSGSHELWVEKGMKNNSGAAVVVVGVGVGGIKPIITTRPVVGHSRKKKDLKRIGCNSMVGKTWLRKMAVMHRVRDRGAAIAQAREKMFEVARAQFRERLAAAAHASFQHCGVYRRNYIPSPLASPSSSRAQSPTPMRYGYQYGSTILGEDAMNGGWWDDMLPSYRRSPSPPSETELNWQRRGLGMGLDIGVC